MSGVCIQAFISGILRGDERDRARVWIRLQVTGGCREREHAMRMSKRGMSDLIRDSVRGFSALAVLATRSLLLACLFLCAGRNSLASGKESCAQSDAMGMLKIRHWLTCVHGRRSTNNELRDVGVYGLI